MFEVIMDVVFPVAVILLLMYMVYKAVQLREMYERMAKEAGRALLLTRLGLTEQTVQVLVPVGEILRDTMQDQKPDYMDDKPTFTLSAADVAVMAAGVSRALETCHHLRTDLKDATSKKEKKDV